MAIGSTSNVVFAGQRITIECEYRLNGVATDPTLVSCLSRDPAGTIRVLTYPDADFVRRSAGLYDASILVTLPGTWVFRAEGTGVVDTVNEMTLNVQASGLS